MALTDTAIRAAKPRDKRYKLSDGGGLQLHVTPQGTKAWRLAYRFNGQQREYPFGLYPKITLAAARYAREEIKQQIASGIDPIQKKKQDKLARGLAAGATFGVLAAEYRSKMIREGKADQTVAKAQWIFETLVGPALGTRPITEITVPEILDTLRKIEARGHYETASRARRMIGQVFRYAIATARATSDPSRDLRGALTTPKSTPRPAIVDGDGIGQLLRAIDGYEGQGVTHLALQFAPLAFPRPEELREAEWPEIDFDAALWRVPAHKMKMGREHLVPLSTQAITLLRKTKEATGFDKLVFHSAWSPKKLISENTLNGALRRLGYCTKTEQCAHGFRRTASTQLHEAGFNSEWVERQLAHVDSNKVRGIYNAAQYLDGRRQMMQWWADRLDTYKAKSPNS